MAKRYQEILSKLDPLAVARYQISEKDIRAIEQYLKIIKLTQHESSQVTTV